MYHVRETGVQRRGHARQGRPDALNATLGVRLLLATLAVVDVALFAVHGRDAGNDHEPPPLTQFADRLDAQFHECVPLGWYPVILSSGGFIPGFNADAVAHGGMFSARWVGALPVGALSDPHAEHVRAVLDAFVARGLLERHEIDGRYRYTLTEAGEAAYYDRNRLGTNAEGWPYLCFSKLDVAAVAWAGPSVRDSSGVETRRIRFRWKPGAAAPWATPFLMAHAVVLDPRTSPAHAAVVRDIDGVWHMLALDFTLPRIEHPRAW